MQKELNENWKPVVGYEGLYEVSDLGNVRSLNYNKTGEVKVMKPRLSRGYFQVKLYNDGEQKHQSIHRLAYAAFKGPIPPGMHVDHVNNIKTDNRIENLQLLTPADNARKANKGRKHSEATKAKLKGRTPWNKGKPRSEATKEKLRKANLGKKLSEETKAKIGKAGLGRTHNEATKTKMSLSAKARWERESSGIIKYIM